MKNLIKLFILLIISSININAQQSFKTTLDGDRCTLAIEMTNLDSDEGQIMIAIYRTKDSWLNKPFKNQLTKIENGRAQVVFEDLPYGIYAASAVHDQDMNGELKLGMLGIPSEPYASSRGAKGMFGPPKWEDAKFNLGSDTTKEIIKF